LAKNSIPAKKEVTMKTKFYDGKRYLTGVWNELKKVHWPSRQQLLAYTGVVLLAVSLIGLIIWLFDSGLSFLLEKLVRAFA